MRSADRRPPREEKLHARVPDGCFGRSSPARDRPRPRRGAVRARRPRRVRTGDV